MKRKATYDSKCFDLAEQFLADEPTLQHKTYALAGEIQAAIEAWIEWEHRHARACAAKAST